MEHDQDFNPVIGKHPYFKGFHLRGLRIPLMVVTEQMQRAVHQHMSPVILDPLTLFAGLVLYDSGTNDDVTEQSCLFVGEKVGRRRKRQHIRCFVLIAVLAVQAPDLVGRNYPDGHLCCPSRRGPGGLERRCKPPANEAFGRYGRIDTGRLDING